MWLLCRDLSLPVPKNGACVNLSRSIPSRIVYQLLLARLNTAKHGGHSVGPRFTLLQYPTISGVKLRAWIRNTNQQ